MLTRINRAAWKRIKARLPEPVTMRTIARDFPGCVAPEVSDADLEAFYGGKEQLEAATRAIRAHIDTHPPIIHKGRSVGATMGLQELFTALFAVNARAHDETSEEFRRRVVERYQREHPRPRPPTDEERYRP